LSSATKKNQFEAPIAQTGKSETQALVQEVVTQA